MWSDIWKNEKRNVYNTWIVPSNSWLLMRGRSGLWEDLSASPLPMINCARASEKEAMAWHFLFMFFCVIFPVILIIGRDIRRGTRDDQDTFKRYSIPGFRTGAGGRWEAGSRLPRFEIDKNRTNARSCGAWNSFILAYFEPILDEFPLKSRL